MPNQCHCGSYAINPHAHDREPGVDLDLCDVCYWKKRARSRGEALERLKQWAGAYPVEVFPEMADEDWKQANEALATAGLSLDRISASNMRHVITQSKEIVADGLST